MAVFFNLLSLNLTLPHAQDLLNPEGKIVGSLQPGNYVAVRNIGQERGVYTLHEATGPNFRPGEIVANVYLALSSDGGVYIDA